MKCEISGVEIPAWDVDGCDGRNCDICVYSKPQDHNENLIPILVTSLIIAAIVLLIIFWPGASHV